MHILWLPLRIQSHNAQSKKARLFTWIQWPRSFLIKENGLTIECHDQPKDLFEGTTFCSFEKGKKKKRFFSKLIRTPHCKERFLHHKVLKEKFRSFSNFLLNKLILKSPCRLDQRSLSSPWLTKCLPTTLELRLDLILPKEVRRQSIVDSVLIICMTLWIGPISWITSWPDLSKRGT